MNTKKHLGLITMINSQTEHFSLNIWGFMREGGFFKGGYFQKEDFVDSTLYLSHYTELLKCIHDPNTMQPKTKTHFLAVSTHRSSKSSKILMENFGLRACGGIPAPSPSTSISTLLSLDAPVDFASAATIASSSPLTPSPALPRARFRCRRALPPCCRNRVNADCTRSRRPSW